MKKILLIILIICAAAVLLVALAGMYKFNYLTSLPGYDVDGNKIEESEEKDTFEIIEVLNQSCQTDFDCGIPPEYAILSNCPYDSVCINNACTVICPMPFTGKKLNLGPKNAAYLLDGQPVTLVNGLAEVEVVLGSAAKVVTQYFGNEVQTDLNNDGRQDVVFLLTQEAGGTGTFFYVVAALNTKSGWIGSHGYFLGDRISPQTTEVSQTSNDQNVIVVNYADRAEGQPMTEQPSVGKSVWLRFDSESMMFDEVK